MSDRDRLVDQLVRHEGLRLKPYTDTAGKITIGCGRNLTDCGISHAEAELLLNNDIDAAVADLATFPWFPSLDAVRQRALVDLRFNVGWAGFLKFKKLIAAIGTGDYVAASEELMKSKIAPNRKQTLVRMLATGIGVLLFAVAAFAQHPEIVGQVKAELQARGVDLSGPCGAFQITKRVAWQLRAEGAGTLDKPSGNACLGRAVDIIAYPDGHIYDILVDSGGSNGPAWQDGGLVETSRYRPAFDPGDTPPPPVVVLPPPVTPPSDLQATILAELRAHEAAEQAERADAAKFRSDVRSVWKSALVNILKYAAPAIGAIFVGRASK